LIRAAGGPGRISFGFDAKRTDGGLEGRLQLNDRVARANIHVTQVTFLGSVRDQCGSVPARANSLQFEGTGTYNGEAASFRVCAQDNGEGRSPEADRFHLACTSGCDYSTGGALGGGNIQVRQRWARRRASARRLIGTPRGIRTALGRADVSSRCGSGSGTSADFRPRAHWRARLDPRLRIRAILGPTARSSRIPTT
jgi:hypothetical protein